MVEAWTIVGEVFVDARFSGHNWDHELTEGLNAAYTADSGDVAYREIGHMLSKLGDPFTRVVPARCLRSACILMSFMISALAHQECSQLWPYSLSCCHLSKISLIHLCNTDDQGLLTCSELHHIYVDLCMCREYAEFRVSSDGEVQGVGLLIAQEPASGRLVVLAPIRGGPADKAGVLPGDEVSMPSPLHTSATYILAISCYKRLPVTLLMVIPCSFSAE